MDIWDDIPSLLSPLPTNHIRQTIPTGIAGTAATIAQMQKLVTQGKRDFRIRSLAGKCIQSCSEKDYRCYAEACFNWIRKNIKYAYDPVGVELIEAPWKIVEAKIADCDSSSILFAAMVESIGLPARFATIKADSGKPDEFSHVFCQVKVPRQGWMTADCTMNHGFGWDPGPSYERQNWPASQDAPEDTDGDAMFGMSADMVSMDQIMERAAPYQGSFYGMGRASFPRGTRPNGKRPMNRPGKRHGLPVVKRMGAFGADAPDGSGTGEWINSPSGLNSEQTTTWNVLQKIVDGRMQKEIMQRAAQVNKMFQDSVKLIDKIKKSPYSTTQSQAMAAAVNARNAAMDAQGKVSEAASKFNGIADELNRYGFNIAKPTGFSTIGLTGMGVIPIASALLYSAAVIGLCVGLATVLNAIAGVTQGGAGYLDQASRLFNNIPQSIAAVGDAAKKAGQGASEYGNAVIKVGSVLLVGAVAVVGIMLLRKASRI